MNRSRHLIYPSSPSTLPLALFRVNTPYSLDMHKSAAFFRFVSTLFSVLSLTWFVNFYRFLFVSEKSCSNNKLRIWCICVRNIFIKRLNLNDNYALQCKESCTSYSLHMKWALERKMVCQRRHSPKKRTAHEHNLRLMTTKMSKMKNSLLLTNGNSFACTLHCTYTPHSNRINAKRFCTTTTIYVHGIYLYGAQQRKMAFNEGNNRLTRSGYENERRKKNAMNSDNNKSTCVPSNHPSIQAQ